MFDDPERNKTVPLETYLLTLQPEELPKDNNANEAWLWERRWWGWGTDCIDETTDADDRGVLCEGEGDKEEL